MLGIAFVLLPCLALVSPLCAAAPHYRDRLLADTGTTLRGCATAKAFWSPRVAKNPTGTDLTL